MKRQGESGALKNAHYSWKWEISNPAYFLKTPKNIINLLLSFGASSTACGASTCSEPTLEFGVAAWLSAWAVELEEEAMLWSFS